MSADWSSQSPPGAPPSKPRITILVWAIGCSAVLVIAFGLLVTLFVPNLMMRMTKSEQAKVTVDLKLIDEALDRYAARNSGHYPDDLRVLVLPDASGARFLQTLDGALPLDPWHRPYLYEPPKSAGARPRVFTLGHDGVVGGTGRDEDMDDAHIRAR